MNVLLLICQFLPLLAFVMVFVSQKDEDKIARISLWSSHALGLSITALLGLWAGRGFPHWEFTWFTLYATDGYRFPILFYLDAAGAVFLACAWAIFSIIIKYCRVYLHREAGYQRFFMTIFGFLFGLNLIILSGSIDMLFAGWEIAGISSFLLIAFYRHRVQPIRNALRAYSVYRFCDIGLLLGAWMSHLLFHDSRHFSQLGSLFNSQTLPPADYGSLLMLSVLILIAAAGKSAQFPFCFWLPRAMEGPTPSSAIFYGALSVHLGVFLLLRTAPIWSYHLFTRFTVFGIGLLTVIIAGISEKTQSNIKGQIAYSSIVQVGFMFMELALGLETLVLVHFLGNAFLRCYQLLVSPSIVAHLLRVEGSADTQFHIDSHEKFRFLPVSLRDILPEVLRNTLYVFSLQEGNLEMLIRAWLWEPLKKLGLLVNDLNPLRKVLYALGIFLPFLLAVQIGAMAVKWLALPMAVFMVLAAISAFSRQHSPAKVWNAIALSGVFAGIGICVLNPTAGFDVVIFAAGIVPAWLWGRVVLAKLPTPATGIDSPFIYLAFAETRPKSSLLLFISFLGLAGFPISPAFLGEDLLLAHASSHDPWFALPIAFAFLINGVAAARVFQKLCMGRPAEWVAKPCEH